MKSYTYEPTSEEGLYRVVDRKGDWRYYWHEPTNRYLKAVNATLDAGFAKGQRFNEWLKNKSAQEAEDILKTAGDRGDAIHQAIAGILRGGFHERNAIGVLDDEGEPRYLTDDEWMTLLTFQTFWNEHGCTLIAFERASYSLKHEFAGTLDVILRIGHACRFDSCSKKCKNLVGKIGIVDWKTGSGIYPNYFAQISAYAKGENLKSILGRHRIQFTGIVRLGTRHASGYEFQHFNAKQTAQNFKDFLSAQRIARLNDTPFDPLKEIYDIPEELNITIEQDKIVKGAKTQTKILNFEGPHASNG